MPLVEQELHTLPEHISSPSPFYVSPLLGGDILHLSCPSLFHKVCSCNSFIINGFLTCLLPYEESHIVMKYTKEIIRICKSKNDRKHYGQKKKDNQQSNILCKMSFLVCMLRTQPVYGTNRQFMTYEIKIFLVKHQTQLSPISSLIKS
jgi:hypothetical protein